MGICCGKPKEKDPKPTIGNYSTNTYPPNYFENFARRP
jgi:hypothetical protein